MVVERKGCESKREKCWTEIFNIFLTIPENNVAKIATTLDKND